MELLIRHGLIVTQDAARRVIEGDVMVEDGLITSVGKGGSGSDHVIDAEGGIVMPGLFNTHTHVGMTDLRGLLDDMNLEPFLEKTFRLDNGRTSGEIQSASIHAIHEMLAGGTTSFADLYYSEDVIAEACGQTGIRGFLAWVTLDREITTQKGDPVKNADDFCKRFSKPGLVTPMVGLQGVYVCSEETAMAAKSVAHRRGRGMHMHLCETRHEVYSHEARTGRRPVDWLSSIGFLDGSAPLLAAHGAWLTRNEMKTLHAAGVSVSSCARSNMKLGSGIPPVEELRSEGVTVSLGTDSATTSNNLDMFEEMRTASLLQKVNKWDASVLPASGVLDMVTRNAAGSLGVLGTLGSIEEGKKADIILLDRRSARLFPLGKENVIQQIVYSAQSSDVTHTIVDGRQVYSRGGSEGAPWNGMTPS